MKREKLKYVPGLISLLGLPILLFFFGPEDEIRFTAMKIFLPADTAPEKTANESQEKFTKQYVLNRVKDKKLVNIYLAHENIRSDEWDDYYHNRNMMYIRDQMDRLAFSCDTTSVVRIKMDESVHYGEFMSVMNMLALYGIRRYALVDDVFYIFANDPPIEYNEASMGIQVEPTNYVNVNPESEWERWWSRFKWRLSEKMDYIKWAMRKTDNKVLLAGFLFLITIPTVWYIRRGGGKRLTAAAL